MSSRSILRKRVKPSGDRPVYVVDTNILYTFLEGQAKFGNKKNKKELRRDQDRIRTLFKTEEVVIPQAVMVEMMGLFFQIQINLNDYNQWHRKRKSVFDNLIIHYIFSERHQVSICDENPGMLAMEISGNPISADCINQLRQQYNHAPHWKKRGKNSREPKLLDGVDTLIIATAIHVATVNNARQCVIVSNDKGLSLALCSLRQGGIGHHGGIPENIEVKTISGI